MAGTTTIALQLTTTIGGISRTVQPANAALTHSGNGFAEGLMPTSDTAAAIPQGGITPKTAMFQNMSTTAGEYIDIMNDTAVLARIDPTTFALFDISQVATPATNLKAKAASGKTPLLAYLFVSA